MIYYIHTRYIALKCNSCAEWSFNWNRLHIYNKRYLRQKGIIHRHLIRLMVSDQYVFQHCRNNRCHPLTYRFYKLEEETWLFSNLNWFLKFYCIIEVTIGLNTPDRKKISFQQKRQQMAKKKFHALAKSISRVQIAISWLSWLLYRFHLSRYILAK